MLLTFGERLRELRKAKRVTRQELGDLIDKSPETIARYERNERNASVEQVRKIAEALDTSVSDLLGEQNVNTETTFSAQNDIIELTVYDIATVVSCEMELCALHRSQGVEVIFTAMDTFAQFDKKDPPFGIIMPNDSMRGAGINEGYYVAINPAEPAESGDPAFVIYNGVGLVRWILKKADGSVELQSANTDYASIKVESEYVNNASKFRIVGRVVEILARIKPKVAF